MTSRGIRNNNPGNIRHGDKWVGLCKEQTDPAFCQFETPEYGIRALVKLLRNYQKGFQAKGWSTTVERIINRYAPPIENNTEAYIKHVCIAVGVDADEHINVYCHDVIIPLIKAIIRHENGEMPYTIEQLEQGIHLANE